MSFFDRMSGFGGPLEQIMRAPNFPAYLPDSVRESIMSAPTFDEHFTPFPWPQAVQDLWEQEKQAAPQPDLVEQIMMLFTRMRNDQGV